MIDPFANNHQSMQIGELIIENQEDKIIIYGDIDIHLNNQGYEQAKQLHQLSGKILQAFESRTDELDKASSIEPNNVQTQKQIDNPFL